jgi:hypothetical protein
LVSLSPLLLQTEDSVLVSAVQHRPDAQPLAQK